MKKLVMIAIFFVLIASGCFSGCLENLDDANLKKSDDSNEFEDDVSNQTDDSQDSNESIPKSCYLNVSSWQGDNYHLCYLACISMLLNYYDKDIGFSDVVVNTGIATSFQIKKEGNKKDEDVFEDEKEEEDESEDIINPFIIPSVMKNLGYKPHLISNGPLQGFGIQFNQIEDKKQLSNKTEFFNKLKYVLSSKNPVFTWMDNSTLWEKYYPSIKISSEPLLVTGYDKENVYTNIATSGVNSTNKSLPMDVFLNGWKEMTPFFIYATENTDYGKNFTEILSELKKHADTAPENLRSCADGLENGSINLGQLGQQGSLATSFGTYVGMRKSLADVLKDKGYEDIAMIYNESGFNFSRVYEISDHADIEPTDVADLLREIANLEEEAYSLWPKN
ncbi:MAG: hypothetical protein V5A68_07235 [Candidatus Thermoplasmatota archaeon]